MAFVLHPPRCGMEEVMGNEVNSGETDFTDLPVNGSDWDRTCKK